MALRQKLRKKNRTPGCRKNGIHNDLSRSSMIRMVDAVGGEQSLRITGNQDIRFEFANDSHNLTAHMQVRNKIAIRSIHEVDGIHTNDFCRRILLLVANSAESVG